MRHSSCISRGSLRSAFMVSVPLFLVLFCAGEAVSESEQVIHPVVTLVNEQSGGGSLLYGTDIFVGNLDAEEYTCDMASSSGGEYFLVVDYLPPATGIDVYRSTDSGNNWWHYASFSGGDYDIATPAITIPEFDKDYLYVIYAYANQIQIVRFDLETSSYDFYNVEANANGVYNPRICTDNINYPGNYWLYVAYISVSPSTTFDVKVARSEDNAENWESYNTLEVQGAFIPAPDITFGNYNLYAVYDSLPTSGEWEVRLNRSTDLGGSWDSPENLTSVTSYSCVHPRVGAINGSDEVLVAYSKRYDPADWDVWYGFSTDAGGSWTKDHCLACTYEDDESWPDIAVNPELGDFHVTFRRATDDVVITTEYSSAPYNNPDLWSTIEVVDDLGFCLGDYPRPVAVNWLSGGAGVAWVDWRAYTNGIFFDRTDREPSYPLEIDIFPNNGQSFSPGENIFWGVFLRNHSPNPIHVTASVYASNNSNWRYSLFGPLNFTIPGNTMLGPVFQNAQVPWGAPPMNAFICAEANDVQDSYPVTIE